MTDPDAGRGAKAATATTAAFERRYLARATVDLPGRSTDELITLASDSLAFGARRRGDETLVRIIDVGGTTSALDVVTADMPYLVDSLCAELERAGHGPVHILHPQLVVARDDDGQLVSVIELDDTAGIPEGAVVESWTHVEMSLVPEAECDQLVAGVRSVLADVQYAAQDAPAMRERIRALADELRTDPGDFDREASAEAGELLAWLADGNFLPLGHAAYAAADLAGHRAGGERGVVDGVLRGTARVSPLELLPAYRSAAPLVIFKSPLVSTVARRDRYDCVTVVTPVGRGATQTIHVFLGLIARAEEQLVERVPVVRRRVAEILSRSGLRADSHSGRRLMAAIRTLPPDELLEAPAADLARLAALVVERSERASVGVFARTHLNNDFVSVLVYIPAERLGPVSRRRVEDVIDKYWPGDVIGRDDRIVDLGLARLHFLIALRRGTPAPNPDRATVELEVASAIRFWTDDVFELVAAGRGARASGALRAKYASAIPEAYKEDFDAAAGARDLATLETLPRNDGLAFELYVPAEGDPARADRRIKVFRSGRPITLAKALPIFTEMGIEVLDERPYEFALSDEQTLWIYDFGLGLPAGVQLDGQRSNDVVEALRLLWRDELEQDGFNALVVRSSLTWWQANVLRAYAKYLQQAGIAYSQGYIERTLVEHTDIARLLVELFESRFDVARAKDANPTGVGLEIEDCLAAVESLDQDFILRALLALVRATVRTNAYRTDDAGTRRSALAFKLDPQLVVGLPEPHPRHEIWVYSPRVEAVHLRFGAVARGGLRWSDRREDFRTEILGLVKAQMVKNAVIVPTGAKGGFVAKRLPDPSVDRDAWMAEGVACYRTFVSCLLDVTDNYVTDADGVQSVVPPPQTRRYDDDDPYLVIAADKGTAAFSDLANSIAADYGYWLGDAFASGGSLGYDHKAMGITARGAWESVKYHFRELGINVQSTPFTAVGIGDMSGDVFGNGMLLSRQIKLIAAFDHRHLFIDPDPDPAASFRERQRLFALPRSSWADYDRSLISPGGGVFARSDKAIPVSPQVASAIGLDPGTTSMTPHQMIRAILLAPADLLWNGGIGTYVKASTEPNTSVGDKANDSLRVDGVQLRVRVVAEGGNLGFTQLGRIEFAQRGGHINTDAIDNSAGVDTSDHEVNLKILLDRAVAAGALNSEERNGMLASVADDIAGLVLRDNYEQNVLLGMARMLDPALAAVHERFIDSLVAAGELDRDLEFLPSGKQIEQRIAEGRGLVSPENAVLAAYAKITLTRQIERSALPEEPWFARVSAAYFPPLIAQRFADFLTHHPLHREIVTTSVVNDMINRGGTTFVFRAVEETGAEVAQVARAYCIVREVFALPELYAAIEALDNQVPAVAQHAAYQEIRRLLDRATRWFLDVRFPLDVAAEIDRFASTVRQLGPQISGLVKGAEQADIQTTTDRLTGLGMAPSIATRVAELLSVFLLLDVVEIANASEHSPDDIAQLHFALSDKFFVDEMLAAITALPRDDRWSTLARAAVRHDVYAALSAITQAVLRSTPDSLSPDDRVAAWTSANAERVERARGTVRAALDRERIDLATLSVALRVMRELPA